MKVLHHVTHQPFIFATGLAALVHSTWSLGTLFSGVQPEAEISIHFAGWLIPAFLIAFAMDVGQIVTSADIRAGQRTPMKYATFAVFAIATYYLQWLYIAHHMPQLELAPGVRATWRDSATTLRDAAIWFIPALLPLSTLLYTFSDTEAQQQADTDDAPRPAAVAITRAEGIVAELPDSVPNYEPADSGDGLTVHCPDCDWSKDYDHADKAARGLRTHQQLHCPGRHTVSLNGAKAEHIHA